MPVLVAGGEVLGDSTDILHWVDGFLACEQRLFPAASAGSALAAEVTDLEARFDEPFGADTRLLAYQLFLVHPLFAAKFLLRFDTIPWWQRAFAPFFLLPMSRFIKRRYAIDEHSAERSRERIVRVLDEVAERLGDGRRFLCGERFTAADLAFATHSSAISLPPQYGAPIARLEDLPGRARQQISSLHDHPACEFARRLYREERQRGSTPAEHEGAG